MGWIQLATLVIPLVSSLIQMAEKAVQGAQQGAIKKQLVTDGITTLAGGMAALSNGGQKNTWTQIGAIAPALIDPLVAIMNAGSELIAGHELFDDNMPEASGGASNPMGHQ